MKETNFIKEEYKKSFGYLKKTRGFIYFAIIFSAVIFVLGVFSQIDVLSEIMNETIEESEIADTLFGQITETFKHNFRIDLLKVYGGVFLGLPPFIILGINSYLYGYVFHILFSSVPISTPPPTDSTSFIPLIIFFVILICEYSTTLISSSLGLKFGLIIFRKERKKNFMNHLRNSTRVIILIIIPLLLLGAIIESIFIFGAT